jgi:hypothetical protein
VLAAVSSVVLLLALLIWGVVSVVQWSRAPTVLDKTPVAEKVTTQDLPLAEDGTVDYLAAFNAEFGEGATPENNAAVLVLEAFGSHLWADEREEEAAMLMAGTCAALGVPAGDPLPDRWVSLEEFVESGRAGELAGGPIPEGLELDRLLWDRGTQPWRADAHPIIAAWLAENGESLDLLVGASKRERWFWPAVGEPGPMALTAMDNVALSPLREAAHALAARATRRLMAGQAAAACGDALALRRLGRLIRSHDGFMIGRLVGAALENYAGDVDMAIASEPAVPAAPKRELATAILALPQSQDHYRIWDKTERWTMHGALSGMLQYEMKLTPSRQDLAIGEEVIDGWYDRLVGAGRLESWAERSAALRVIEAETEALEEELESPSALPKMLASDDDPREMTFRLAGLTCWLLLCPALERYYAEQLAATQRGDINALALLLSVYRSENGDYPDALSGLVPGLLDEVPSDRFTEGDLVYRRTADGYVLYSRGPNMTDDGGPHEDRDVSDDIGVIVPP